MPSASDNFFELKDCVFIRGFPANVNFTASDIRKYFNDRVGKCCVEMTALSKDKGRLFIVLKFDSKAAAQNAIERFSGKHVLNYKLRLNFWRAPLNMVRSERSSRDSYEKYHQRWDHNIRSDKETEESLRHHKNSTREQNSHSTNHLPRNSMPYDDHVEFKKESDNFRGFQQHTYMDRYETNDDFKNYQEKNEEYSQDRWSSDSGRERQYPVLDLDWSEWESNLRGSSENLSERGFYEREQEFLHPRGDKFWREREADQERRPELVDEDFTKDYDDNFFQCENYFEFTDNHHAHNERLSPVKAESKRDQRGDRFCARNDREWFGNREFTEETRRNFPPSDQSAEWPRWETVALSNQTRKPFSLDVMKDTPTHVTRGLNPRVSPPPEGRPRSDEWVRNITRNFRSKDRHSASPVNIRSQTFGRAGSPLAGNTSSQTISDSARSRKGRGSISPVRNRHSTNGRSNRSCSVDKGFGSKTHESSPMNGRLSYSYNEHSFGRKTRESRSFSPNPNTKTSWPRGHGNNGKEVDLRRSFMMHQQGKHSSSRERDREVSLKHSPRRTRSSLEKYKVEPSSCRQAINRKRRNEDDLRRDDRTKRRRQTSSGICDNASSQLGNGNSDSTRKRHKRETDERIKLSPRDRERKARRSRDPAACNSNTRRADRFLSDLAVTLAQGKVLNKGPEANLRASKENASTSGNYIEGKCRGSKTRLPVNSARESEGSRTGERRYHEQEKAAAASDKNKQSSNVEEGISCAELAMEGDNEESIIEAEVSSCNEPSDQEEEEETDGNESSNLSEDDSERADSYENSISFEDDFLDVDEDLSSVIDDEIDDDMPEINDIDGDGTDECSECSKLSTGNSENADHFEITGKGLQRNNSSSDEEFSKLNLAEELMEVVHTADLRDFRSLETLEKLDYVETLSEKENKTSHDDQVTNSDESFQELILKQEVKEHTENVIHEESMSTTAHHTHGDISSVQGKPPEWEEGKESCHLNAKSNMGKNASQALSVEVSSRTQVLNMSPDNVLTRDEDKADGSLCQKEEREAMYRSKENYQEADVESVPEDITRDRTSSTKISCFPGTLSNTETDYRRDDKFNPQFIDRRSGPKVPLSVTSCNSTKDNSGPLNEGSYNEEKSYCNGSENLAVCTTESERVRDSIRRTKEGQYELKSNNRKHSNGADNEDKRDQRNVKSCDLDPLINNKSDVKTETSRRVLPLKKREDTITYATFQDKFLCKQGEVYIPGEARVARKEVCHNNEDGLVHNWNVKDVRLPEGSTSDREQDLPKEGAVVKNGLDGDSDDFEDHLGQEHAMHHAETLNDTKTKVGSRDVSNSREEKDLESRRRSEEVFPSVKDDIFSGTADLQRVDMEISLEGEIPDVSKELSLRVDNDTVAEDGDGNRPYSPSSPTWTSEEHRSPLPKDDMSLYSPSRPTSVSGSDAQRSIIVEDLSNEDRNYDGIEPVFDSMEVGCDLPEKENVTVNSGITKGPFTSSFIFCSSPKSESELLQGQSILDITEENILRRPVIPNSKIENRKVKDENGKCDEDSLGKDSEILSNNPGTEKISKDDLRYMKHQEGTNGLVPLASVDVKPKIEYITATKLHKAEDVKVLLENSVKEMNYNDDRKSLRCQERTQSLPTSATMDVIPKKAYVTSARTYLVYTDSGTRHKPRIFYATNDTTARPARSLSLDTAWSSDENPEQGPSKASSNNEEERRQSAAKRADITIRSEEENPDSLVEPSLSSGPCSWDSPLKLNGDMSEDGDQSVTLVRGLFVNLGSDNMAVLPDPGRDNCADARVTMSANTASTTSSPSSGDIILALSSDQGNEESLPIRTPLQPTDKEAPVKNDGRNSPSCLSHNEVSSDIQALCGTNNKDFSPATDHHLNTSSQVAKTTKSVSNLAISDISNDNLRPDEPSVTSVVTGNMPVACGRDDQIVSLLMCSDDIQSANAEMQGKNENDFQTEFSLGGIQRQASVNQNGDNTCHSTPANIKRPRPDSSEEPFHTSKVARKALKLIMPTDRTPNPRGKANPNSALFTRYSKKTSSCTMTSADLAIVAERSPAHVVVGDALFTNKRNHVGNDVCAENDSSCRNISIDNRDSHTFKNDGFTLALKTGMSPPTTNIESHMQTQSFVADISVKDHTGTRILSDIEASCRRKETEQVAFKMEKLRKKKEEIEQVYKQECETVISVVKMLVRNDPRLEGLLQNAVRRTLQDMGRRCVQELEKQARPGT